MWIVDGAKIFARDGTRTRGPQITWTILFKSLMLYRLSYPGYMILQYSSQYQSCIMPILWHLHTCHRFYKAPGNRIYSLTENKDNWLKPVVSENISFPSPENEASANGNWISFCYLASNILHFLSRSVSISQDHCNPIIMICMLKMSWTSSICVQRLISLFSQYV